MDVDPQLEQENPQTCTENSPEKENPLTEREKPVDARLKDWTKNEIFQLLHTIKNYGSRDIALISEYIRTKSPSQIRNAIAYYREKAVKQAPTSQRRKMWTTKKNASRPPVPLIGWAKFLQDSLSFKDLHTETATALRIIAEFDNIPSAAQTENVDFKNIYHSIANAMEGKAIPDNPPMATILNKCIVETALTSRAFMRMGALQNVVEWIDMSDKAISVLPRPTENNELATLRHLASQRMYNPLGIAEQYLKPT